MNPESNEGFGPLKPYLRYMFLGGLLGVATSVLFGGDLAAIVGGGAVGAGIGWAGAHMKSGNL
jgi:hypothetical protein